MTTLFRCLELAANQCNLASWYGGGLKIARVRACDLFVLTPHYAPPSPGAPLLQGYADAVDRLSTLDALDSTITAAQQR